MYQAVLESANTGFSLTTISSVPDLVMETQISTSLQKNLQGLQSLWTSTAFPGLASEVVMLLFGPLMSPAGQYMEGLAPACEAIEKWQDLWEMRPMEVGSSGVCPEAGTGT